MLRLSTLTMSALMMASCAASAVSSPNQPPPRDEPPPASAPEACPAGASVLAPLPELGDEQAALIERDGPCLDGDVDVCRIHRPLFEGDDVCEIHGCEAWWVYVFEDGRLQGLGVYWWWVDVGEEDLPEFVDKADRVACRLEARWGAATLESPTPLETAVVAPEGQASVLARRRWDAGLTPKTWEVRYTPAHHPIVALAIDVGEAPLGTIDLPLWLGFEVR